MDDVRSPTAPQAESRPGWPVTNQSVCNFGEILLLSLYSRLTEELALSHYFKRATMIEPPGSTDWHLRRFEALRAAG